MVIRWCEFKPGENLNWNWASLWNLQWTRKEKRSFWWWWEFVHEPDWKSFRAQTREIFLDRMESSDRKNVMYRVAEFSFAGKSLFVLFLALFYDEKVFVNHSRILSARLSWCLDRITARTDTILLVHLHFADFFSSSLARHSQAATSNFCSFPESKLWHRKKMFHCDKELAIFFCGIEKKILSPGLLSSLIRNSRRFYRQYASKSTRFDCEILHFCSSFSFVTGNWRTKVIKIKIIKKNSFSYY